MCLASLSRSVSAAGLEPLGSEQGTVPCPVLRPRPQVQCMGRGAAPSLAPRTVKEKGRGEGTTLPTTGLGTAEKLNGN